MTEKVHPPKKGIFPHLCVHVFMFVRWFSVIIHDPDCSSVTLPTVMYVTVAHWAQTRRKLYGEFRKACANVIYDEMIQRDEMRYFFPVISIQETMACIPDNFI